MASLQYVLSCTTNPHSSSFRPVFPKQSHFITHANRSRRLRVCCQNHKDRGNSKIDRRNMLLGLGGLYGATNLFSTPGQASAEPIAAPELDKCILGRNWVAEGQPLDEKCCLLADPNDVSEYTIPPVERKRIRKPVHLLSDAEVTDFEDAIREMKKLPPSDPHSFTQQSKIHCAYCNASYIQPNNQPHEQVEFQVHHNWLFFPFHRWYLYFFEKICGKLIEKPDFALPYWNWDHPDGMTVSPIFTNVRSPLYDEFRDWDNALYDLTKPVYLGGDAAANHEVMKKNNIAVMYQEMMTNYSSPTEFMGKPYRKGEAWKYRGEGKSENGSHNAIHWWIGTKKPAANQPNKPPLFQSSNGEDMGNFYSSGKDPLFYCHHSNVDRMLTIWQGLPPKTNKFITDNDFLDTKFIFFDENKMPVRVSVKGCMGDGTSNATDLLGYEYSQQDTPWKCYTPTAGPSRASMNPTKVEDLILPIELTDAVTVIVPKARKGFADEYLLIEEINYDPSKFVKFDVFINDMYNYDSDVQKASYAGTFSQVPTKSNDTLGTANQNRSIELRLTELYKKNKVKAQTAAPAPPVNNGSETATPVPPVNNGSETAPANGKSETGPVEENSETVLVTLVPRFEDTGIKIGKIRIIENPYNKPVVVCGR